MTASAPELIGILVACGAAAAALVLEDRRWQHAAMALALLTAPVLVLGSVWDEARVVDFRHSPAHVGAAVVVGGAALAALAAVFRRRPEWFAIAAFAVLPLRIPVEIGGETANLLVPLYLVIASNLIAAVPHPRKRAASRERRADGSPWPKRLRWLAAPPPSPSTRSNPRTPPTSRTRSRTSASSSSRSPSCSRSCSRSSGRGRSPGAW